MQKVSTFGDETRSLRSLWEQVVRIAFGFWRLEIIPMCLLRTFGIIYLLTNMEFIVSCK